MVEGEDGTAFYILIKGEVNVIKNGIGVVATLPGGTSFGELALTEDHPIRTATVTCTSKKASLLGLCFISFPFSYFSFFYKVYLIGGIFLKINIIILFVSA